jgi:DNA (cytosine-5)-methyltransferase 1
MRVFDLFCGVGGFSSGFQAAGFDIVLGIDTDLTCRDSFEANHRRAVFIEKDIRDITDEYLQQYGPCDVLIGSPPCVDFSLVNTDRDPDKGLELVKEFMRIKELLNPKVWVMENVAVAEKYARRLVPYLRADILDAVDFGVPQFRRRMFLGNYPSPLQTHCEFPGQMTLVGTTLEPWRKLRDVLDPTVRTGFIGKNRESTMVRLKRRHRSSTGVRVGEVPYPDPIDKPSRTLLAKISKVNRNTIVVDTGNGRRLLSLEERARIQGFPDDFKWFGTSSQIERHVGNAVPPPVARAIAEAIIAKWEYHQLNAVS